MLRDSTGVIALSSAFLCAAATAACTTDHLDFFDPSWPENMPAPDAGWNPSPEASAVDDARPSPEAAPPADAGQGPGVDAGPASHDAGPLPVADAMDPKDGGVTVPEDAGGMVTVDAPVIDVRFELNLPGFDAGWPFDSGNVGFDCLGVHGIDFRGHCYFAIPATAWEQGACESRGAHLATLTSADEQLAVAALAPGQERWIGLRRWNGPQRPNSFTWVTDEPVSYTNWHVYSENSREPNYSGECVRLLADGTWADNDCSDRFPALCEHE